MSSRNQGTVEHDLPAGEDFLDRLAECLLGCLSDESENRYGDPAPLILVPSLPLAGELRVALARAAGRPMLLPRFDTLGNWVASISLPGTDRVLASSQRLVLLHEALRGHGWFEETALWGMASEMAALFDELTDSAVAVAGDESLLVEQLQKSYDLKNPAPLAFEARVVHDLWRALAATGQPDEAEAYRLRLGELLRRVPSQTNEFPRLLVLLESLPEESLDHAGRQFFRLYAQSRPVDLFYPAPRRLTRNLLSATLAEAWPEEPKAREVPLYERAIRLASASDASPLEGRLNLVPTQGREQEAQAVVAQLSEWLSCGLRRIALIAQDRLTVRRVCALLEREDVLVRDETGWVLSTSRAAATVDALIESVAGGAYYRDLLDLCKSPFVFADIPMDERKRAVFALESAIRTASARSGLSRFRRVLSGCGSAGEPVAIVLLNRLDAAYALLDARPASLARWIGRLQKALEVLGALPALSVDAAGQVLLELLDTRQRELQENPAPFSLSAWRDWLNREFEAASFHDATVSSPIVVTPLGAVCLRRFEAALLIGGDARHMAPQSGSGFFNQSVRRELGLPTLEDRERKLRRDLELLLETVPRVVVTWASVLDGEANLLAPELSLLSTLHELAWKSDLFRRPLPARPEAEADCITAPVPTRQATPVAPWRLIPERISVSAYSSLVACPYRFFARHVLRLGEFDEVSEEIDKSDYGALVHRVLERFHERHPVLSVLAPSAALAALETCSDEVFAAAVEDDFLATGWRLRWGKQLPSYLEWQCGREMEGWRWAGAERNVRCLLPLEGGGQVELYGRIDRVDARSGEELALLDYKTQKAKPIRDRLDDDLQLPAYVLMHGHAVQAAYVALDDERVVAVACANEGASLEQDAANQGRRLVDIYAALRSGMALPAHGTDRVCLHCAMRGLCRRDHV